MARRLVERGNQVTMICGSSLHGNTGLDSNFKCGRREGVVDGINVIELEVGYSNHHKFWARIRSFVFFAVDASRLALTQDYDLLFATSTPLTTGIPGILARWIRRKLFVFEVRDLWPELPIQLGIIKNPALVWAASALEICIYKSANRCVGLAPGIVSGMVSRGVRVDRVRLIPNGCDLTIFSSNAQPELPATVHSDKFVAVFSGTHGPANGLDSIIKVARILKIRKREDIQILLIGDGKEKARLQKMADEYELRNVIFCAPVSKYKVARIIKGASIGLQILKNVPGFYNGTSPNKFFDYIAGSLPVLCNYPGWISELIDQNQCGYVVDPECPELFADALEHAASNPDSLVRMSENALSLARKSFDRSHLADDFIDWITFRDFGVK